MKFSKSISIRILLLSLIILSQIKCSKIVSVPEPVTTVTSSEAFSTDAQANSVLAGVYSAMINTSDAFICSGALSVYTAMSSDELNSVDQTASYLVQFQNNELQSTNGILNTNFWTPAYSYIYTANAAIAELESAHSISDSARRVLKGEAKFVRALCYYYLVNIFGDVPLVLTTNYNKTSLLAKTSSTEILSSVVADLKDAIGLLPVDYSISNGERIRPNKWAADALLARVSLLTQNWATAESYSDSVISNYNLFQLQDSLPNVFLKNSSEAIWQLQPNSQNCCNYSAVPEGVLLIPYDSTHSPTYSLTPQLLNSFEANDKRRLIWVDSVNFNGSYFYYPYKYTIGPAQVYTAPQTQYYMVLRLAEQYLIRAESRLQNGDVNGAIADMNRIRNRAGLTNYLGATDKQAILNAILHERQTELFCEWGQRWLDLKRTGLALPYFGTFKPNWSPNALLYPIPLSELIADPNLKQNIGYN